MNLQDNPRYQRAVQIMARYNPRQKAIFNTVAADRAFAATDMGKKIQLLRMAADEKVSKGRLDLNRKKVDFGQQQADKRFDWQEDAYDYAKKQSGIAELIGVGGVGLKTYFGSKDIENKQRLAQMINSDRNRLFPGAKLFF
jgi:hypothetical protein